MNTLSNEQIKELKLYAFYTTPCKRCIKCKDTYKENCYKCSCIYCLGDRYDMYFFCTECKKKVFDGDFYLWIETIPNRQCFCDKSLDFVKKRRAYFKENIYDKSSDEDKLSWKHISEDGTMFHSKYLGAYKPMFP